MTGMARQREAFPHADTCMRRLLAAASLSLACATVAAQSASAVDPEKGPPAETRGVSAQAARDAVGDSTTKILGVTGLTSSNDDTLRETGQIGTAQDQVLRLAELTRASGLAGIVCSAHEIKLIRDHIPAPFALMVPDIRPAGSDAGDQKRIMTPKDAIDLGATHLVIGRPITGAPDPAAAYTDIINSL